MYVIGGEVSISVDQSLISWFQTSLTPEQRELGSIIEESGSVLLQVINDILDYSKLSSGAFSISTDVPVSIPALSKTLPNNRGIVAYSASHIRGAQHPTISET
jgi:signal transduction histidine kinase